MKIVRNAQRAAWKAQSLVADKLANRWDDLVPSGAEVKLASSSYGIGGAAYNVATAIIDRSSVVYSVGVGNETSFDDAMVQAFDLQVHAFDPTPESAAHMAHHCPDGVTFHPIAISSTDGTMRMQTLKASDNYRAGTLLDVSGSSVQGQPHQEVPTRRLSSIAAELGHDRIDVLKMDIEGGEYSLIEEIAACETPIGQLVFEFHPHVANLAKNRTMIGRHGWQRTAEAIERLQGAGFRIFWVSDRGTEFSFAHTSVIEASADVLQPQ